ncbi:hypothetical protein FNV43_RR06131 [Rhamnella rubrinervis]|uniref:Uncharacterized protein n=1 Tax=Rhamnella rubrinervis TaxID=2594499 RepID=A0A8K0ML69_9ROSA|nr:hypothetical protein FNV43_RR06131 [Rhamnella rubrinervis]
MSTLIKFQLFSTNSLTTTFSLIPLLLLPILVSSTTTTCICDPRDEDQNKSSEALKYKLIAVASVLSAGALGVCLPFLVKNLLSCLNPDKEMYFLIKAFAAGVILATGFIHVLPDAYESLTSPCLSEKPWKMFPFTGFVSMVSAICTLMMEALATGYQKRSAMIKPQPMSGTDDHVQVVLGGHDDGHVHVHGSAFALETSTTSSHLIRHRIISQVLELGIVVHSVIIGISLGASQSPNTIRPLVAALSFHQFFEGMGLGGCIQQAKFKLQTVVIMVVLFSLTTPVGIAVGIGISNTYNDNTPTALTIQGIFLAASAGILIYMALVDLLAADFMNPKLLTNFKLQLGTNFSLLLGAACMSLLAKWG